MPNRLKASWCEWLFYIAMAFLVLVLAVNGSMHSESNRKIEKLEQEKHNLIKELESKRLNDELANKPKPKPPTKAKVAPKPVPVVVQAKAGTCEIYRPLVAKYGWNVKVAMAVMYAESGCNPNAVSSTNDYGLFQLHGIPIYDPAKNVEYAYHNKYMKGGWSHWTVCNAGIVDCWV